MTDERSKRNIKTGFTAGAFDLLHAGHIIMLEEAKSVCDHLTVAVQSDPSLDRTSKNKPIQSYEKKDYSSKGAHICG